MEKQLYTHLQHSMFKERQLAERKTPIFPKANQSSARIQCQFGVPTNILFQKLDFLTKLHAVPAYYIILMDIPMDLCYVCNYIGSTFAVYVNYNNCKTQVICFCVGYSRSLIGLYQFSVDRLTDENIRQFQHPAFTSIAVHCSTVI